MNDDRPRPGNSRGDDLPIATPGANSASPQSTGTTLFPLPGLLAISFYLILLSVVIVVGAVGGHYPKLFLVLPVFFLASCGGLLMRFRWAWAMALAAVLLLSGYNLWLFVHMHLAPSLIQGLLNLVFFLYLIRMEVRERLR